MKDPAFRCKMSRVLRRSKKSQLAMKRQGTTLRRSKKFQAAMKDPIHGIKISQSLRRSKKWQAYVKRMGVTLRRSKKFQAARKRRGAALLKKRRCAVCKVHSTYKGFAVCCGCRWKARKVA
jgi:hypothetical protein